MSLEKSSQEEEEFFEQRDPWKQLKHKGVLGIPNLITKLTNLYLEMIQSTMPSVLSELRRKKQELEQELLQFDANLSTAKLRREFAASVENDVKTRFSSFITEPVVVRSNSEGWTYRALLEKTKKDFADKVFNRPFCKEMRPTAFKKGDSVMVFVNGKEIQAEIAHVKESEKGVPSSATYRVLPKNPSDYDSFLQKVSEKDVTWEQDAVKKFREVFSFTNGDVGVIWETFEGAKQEWKYRLFISTYTSEDLTTDTAVDVASMRNRIERLRGSDLPVFLNASIFNSIVSSHLESEWMPLSKQFASDIRDLVLKFINENILETMKSRAKRLPKFLVRIERAVMDHVDALFKASAASIEAACEIERTPSTFNHYFSENITKQRFEKQKRQLRSLKDAQGNIPYATVELVLNQNSCKSIDDFVAEDMLIVLDSYGASEAIYSIFINVYIMLMRARYKYDDIACRESRIQALW
jgi:hypothetical protein